MLAIITTKLPSASTSPWTREARMGPQPCAKKCAGEGSAVIEFHSLMVRIQRAAPLDDVGEIEPNTASWRAHHGPMTTRKRPRAATPARIEIGWRSSTWLQARRPRCARQPRTRSASQTRPIAPASRMPSLRASVARPASSPAIANDRPSPLRPRAVSHSVAATSGWRIAKFSGWAMNTVAAPGTAEMTPAATPTSGRAPASRAISHVSGATSEPMSTPGMALAIAVGPRIDTNGACRKLASGSQCAFDGMGSTAGFGRWLPTSAKIHTKSMLRPFPAAIERATST